MACTDRRSAALADLAAGRLDGARIDALLEHVATCAECSDELDVVAAMTRPPRAKAPAAARWRATPPRSLRLRRRFELLAAAVLIAALGLFFHAARTGPDDPADLARLEPIPAAPGTLRGVPDDEAFDAAMAAYAAGDWDATARHLAEIAGERAPLAALYRGIALAQLGRLADARAAFDVAAEGEGLVAERARWYRANVLLRSGDVDGARAELEALRAADGEYAPNAAELLEELGPASEDE